MSKTKALAAYSLGLFLFLSDRAFKHLALTTWQNDNLVTRWFGWHVFLNSGVAFSLPVPVAATIVLSVLVLVCLGWWFVVAHSTTLRLAIFYVMLGAVSNLFDRVVYSSTIDYLRLVTAVINIADVLIAAGFVLLIWIEYQSKED